MNLGDGGTVARHHGNKSQNSIIAARRGKEPEFRTYENENSLFGLYSPARLAPRARVSW